MSKKYKDKRCVYCAAPAGTTDHVFARKFFLVRDRANLPKVPACSICAGNKSTLEHYALSVLPFGGRHPTAHKNLASMVLKRLRKNAPLCREIREGAGRKWERDDTGLIRPAMTIPVDTDRLVELFALITRGLIWHHWQTYLSSDDSVKVTMLTEAGERIFEERFFQLEAWDRVVESPGNGTFHYEGIRCLDCAQATVWRIKMLGGVRLAGDPEAPDEVSSTVGVVTQPQAQDRSTMGT